MAYHVPFNQRHSARHANRSQRPVYIGFDVPARRKFNWWGFHGMWLSVASLLTAGFLSPIPLLFSLIGLFRPGKKMASFGMVVSLLGIALASTIVAGISTARHQVEKIAHAQQVELDVIKTKELLTVATDEIVEFRDHHNGALPNDVDANMLVIKHIDPWGKSLRFDTEVDYGVIRSAGPDQKFETDDDVSTRIDGKTARKTLLIVPEASAD